MSLLCSLAVAAFIRNNAQLTSFEGHQFLAQRRVNNLDQFNFLRSTITTSDVNFNLTLHAIKGYPEQVGELAIEVDGLHSVNGRLLAINEDTPPIFLYKPEHKLISRSLVLGPRDFSNIATATGLGIVVELQVNFEFEGNLMTKIILNHNDYDYMNKRRVAFVVEYVARPNGQWNADLERLQNGNEALIEGHIVGRNNGNRSFIVEVRY